SFGALSAGRHNVEIYADDATDPAQSTLLASAIVDATALSGWIDIINPQHIVGWGQALGAVGTPLLRLDVNGIPGVPFLANVVRTDGLAGFDVEGTPLAPGSTNTVTLNYIDPVNGKAVLLDRKTLVVSEPPV